MRAPGARLALLGVLAVVAALYLIRLGQAPFDDPPEGLHAAIANEMAGRGDWVTPHFNGVRYFDKPPLLYWLMAVGFGVTGPTAAAARLWSALPAIGTGVLTAWLGTRIVSARLGFLAGLIVAANLEAFVFGRLVKPDLLFVFSILVAYAGFIVAYQSADRRPLLLCYAALGAAVLAKDILGAAGPVVVVTLFFLLTREKDVLSRWVPWTGLGLLALIGIPWYLAMEWRNHGFLWYTLIDNHLLNFTRQRVFPDEDVPLTAAEFLGVTAIGFFPWSLALPWALVRAFKAPREDPENRIWLLLALWTTVVLGFFTFSPFKLPHYGLPAFPAMALLVAKHWDDALEMPADRDSARLLLLPPLIVLAGLAILCWVVWRGEIALPSGTLSLGDVYARNLGAQGQSAPFIPYGELQPLMLILALIFGGGAVGVAASAWAGSSRLGLCVLLAVMIAFLPVTTEGLTLFATHRSATPIIDALRQKAAPDDTIVHEGALENSGSLVLTLGRRVKIVDGWASNLAFGATFPEVRETFWDRERLRKEWDGRRRIFLVSVKRPERSLVGELPRERVHLLLAVGGRWLYSNRP